MLGQLWPSERPRKHQEAQDEGQRRPNTAKMKLKGAPRGSGEGFEWICIHTHWLAAKLSLHGSTGGQGLPEFLKWLNYRFHLRVCVCGASHR